VAGSDSCIATVPDGLYVRVGGGPPALDVRALGRLLRGLSEQGAAGCGEVLHHADWVITDDPAVVEEQGMHGRPDCERRRVGVDQALAYLAAEERGRRKVLVGVLYWAEQAESAGRGGAA
jgi:hypothetical protein